MFDQKVIMFIIVLYLIGVLDLCVCVYVITCMVSNDKFLYKNIHLYVTFLLKIKYQIICHYYNHNKENIIIRLSLLVHTLELHSVTVCVCDLIIC